MDDSKVVFVSRETIDECSKFWEYWAKQHPKEWDNLIKGKPQFENINDERNNNKGMGRHKDTT